MGKKNKRIFYLDDGTSGQCKGGLFVRNPLKEFIEKVESKGVKVVGIVYDGSYNLELLFEGELKQCD